MTDLVAGPRAGDARRTAAARLAAAGGIVLLAHAIYFAGGMLLTNRLRVRDYSVFAALAVVLILAAIEAFPAVLLLRAAGDLRAGRRGARGKLLVAVSIAAWQLATRGADMSWALAAGGAAGAAALVLSIGTALG